MRAFANLNDRTLKLICGKKKEKKNSRQVPLSFPLLLSLGTYRQPLHKRARDPYLNVRCNPFRVLSAATVGSLDVIILGT